MPESQSRARDRRSMRMIWKTLRLRHVGLAFFWACSMLTFRSSILLSGPANSTSCQTLIVIVSFVANMTTLFFIASRMEGDPRFYERLQPSAFTACILLGLVLLAGSGRLAEAGLLPGPAMFVPLLAGALLTGTGYGFFWGSWAEYLGRMHPSRTSFYVPVAFLLTATLFVLFSFGSEELGLPALALMLPLPVLSQLCLVRCKREIPEERLEREADPKRYRAALGSLVSLIVASLVLSCLFGFVWQMTVVSVDSAYEAHRLPLIVNMIAAALLVALVVFARRRIDLSFAFSVLVPVLVILFAVMPFFWETNPVVLNVIMSTSYGVFDVIIWYMVASTAYDFAVSGFVVGGIVRGLSIIARLVGIGIGYVVMLIPESPSMLIVGVSVGAVYVLAMLALFHRTRHRFAFLHGDGSGGTREAAAVKSAPAVAQPAGENAARRSAEAVVITVADAADHPVAETAERAAETVAEVSADHEEGPADSDVYDQISVYYGLTRREAEVLPYLARGRSAKVIAEALFVSESTIRTHTRRILEKTALHSKQELIDLIENYD